MVVKGLIMSKDQECGHMKQTGEEDYSERRGGQKPPHHPQPRKKQVRRRLQTTKPYQERILNMAEARREIVSALKLHRAAMKEARGKQKQVLQSPFIQQPCLHHSSATAYYTTHPGNYSYPFPHSNEFSWFSSSNAALLSAENLDFALPERTLGLNLNFSDFDDLDYTLFHNNNLPCSSISSSTLSSSSSPNLSSSATTDQEVAASVSTSPDPSDPIHCIGEHRGDENGCHPFEEAMEIPAWLHSNDSFLLDDVNHQSSENFFQDDNPLPCMDIGDIEGVDGEWLV